jgi:hypothetical protein
VTDGHIGSVAGKGENLGLLPMRDAIVAVNPCCGLEMPYIAVNHRGPPPVGPFAAMGFSETPWELE